MGAPPAVQACKNIIMGCMASEATLTTSFVQSESFKSNLKDQGSVCNPKHYLITDLITERSALIPPLETPNRGHWVMFYDVKF